MELLLHVIFPVVLYILAIVLLIVLIVLGIKMVQTIDRANILLEDIQDKVTSLDQLFHIMDHVSGTVSVIAETFVGNIVSLLSRIFSKKKKEEEDYE